MNLYHGVVTSSHLDLADITYFEEADMEVQYVKKIVSKIEGRIVDQYIYMTKEMGYNKFNELVYVKASSSTEQPDWYPDHIT